MPVPALGPFAALRRHWPEYAMQSAPWTNTSVGTPNAVAVMHHRAAVEDGDELMSATLRSAVTRVGQMAYRRRGPANLSPVVGAG